jgi:hypothetical protein
MPRAALAKRRAQNDEGPIKERAVQRNEKRSSHGNLVLGLRIYWWAHLKRQEKRFLSQYLPNSTNRPDNRFVRKISTGMREIPTILEKSDD